MEIQPSLIAERLLIQPLTISDANFILELVNTEGWITFIGNRNITSQVDASAYILRILENTNTSYWVVKRKDNQQAIGIVTYIKRDYLEHHDIGFAFLPHFTNNGYAYEATTAVLTALIQEHKVAHILATTVPENIRSIKLLKKIGLVFEKEIDVKDETLHVYGAPAEKLHVLNT
jgi:[ribosomal protein S5]-alanine N-acetyltransferase